MGQSYDPEGENEIVETQRLVETSMLLAPAWTRRLPEMNNVRVTRVGFWRGSFPPASMDLTPSPSLKGQDKQPWTPAGTILQRRHYQILANPNPHPIKPLSPQWARIRFPF